jgi:hypothetical protein
VISAVITFRKPALTVFAWIGMSIVTTGYAVAAILPKPSTGTFIAAVVFALFVYVMWLVGGHSAVRMGQDGVIVDNLLARHVIPWGELAEIDVGNGLVFRLRGGGHIGSVMFGGSVIGALLGYRYTRSVAERMNAAREEILHQLGPRPVTGGGYRRVLGFSPWPPLAIVAVMEAIASLSVLVK